MRKDANLVIIGAGIVGCSAAYHLTQLGWRDIVVVDQGPLPKTGGSSSHAPGLIFQTNSSRMMTEFAKYTVRLLSELEYDGVPCWYPVGGIEVAYTPERMRDLHRRHGWATAYNLASHIITPAEVQAMIPLLDPGIIHGGYYVPSDGDTNGWRASGAMTAKAIATGGAEFHGHTVVRDITVENGRVTAVVTDKGTIRCEHVLLCTNIWGPVLADKLGVKLPMMAVEHQYLISEPLPELAGETREIVHPILRHQDVSMYFRQHADAYGIGSYRHEPLLVDPYDIGADAMRPFTEDDFGVAQRATNELLPALAGRDYVTRFNGMFVFTVDGMPLMGPTHVDGFWTAVGVWVTHSGGVGKAIAEWMTYGTTELDLREANVNRFHEHAKSRRYIHLRTAQQYREVYDIIHPLQQMEEPRNLRVSPFHSRLQAQKGVFFESAGWEVAQWYEENARLLEKYEDQIPERDDWSSRYWSPINGAEHLATRENVGLFNLANFTKIVVDGPGAEAYLEYLAANKIGKGVDKTVYTALLNEVGGIQADLTITQTGPERFLILTGAGGGPRDLDWIRRHAPNDGSVAVHDVTASYAAVGLWGPKARDVLAQVAEEDVSNEAFPYFTAQRLTIDTVPAYALRLSYAGELGWEIYCPTEHGLHLWDVLWEAGRPHDIIAAGGGAFGSLRLEKGYRAWGADIHTEYNPYEAGLGWAVRLRKGDFLGRDALLNAREQGLKRKLCCLTLDEPGVALLGKEPILHNGRSLGYVSSADYGYNVGKFIAYGYLPVELAEKGRRVAIAAFDRRVTASVDDDPLFDAAMARLKA